MAKNETFILSDQSLNSYGFRVMTAGIDYQEFQKNPVMYWNHQSWDMPIGRWDNIRVEDTKLLADAVFDTEDPLAQKVQSKVKQKILRATSVGLDIKETSTESVFVVQGQIRPTITQSKIYEASVVGIPSNSNALLLRMGDKSVQLSYGEDIGNILPTIHQSQPQNLNKEWEELAKTFNMNPSELMAYLKKKESQVQDMVLELGKEKNMVNAKNEAHYPDLAKSNLAAVLELIKLHQSPSGTVLGQLRSTTAAEDKNSWDFQTWSKKDPQGLLLLKKQNPDKYEELAKNYKP